MKSSDNRTSDMFFRVRDFGARVTTEFPPDSLGGQAFADVSAAIDGIQRQATLQLGSSGNAQLGTAARAAARTALQSALHAMIVTVRAMAIDLPGLEKKFRLPRTGDQNLLNAARTFVENAEPLKAKFIQHSMGPDFIEELKRLIDAFQAAVTAQHDSTDARVKATSLLDALTEQGLRAVHRLDAIVPNQFRNNRAMLSAWKTARHIERRKPRSSKQPKQDPAKPGGSDSPPTS